MFEYQRTTATIVRPRLRCRGVHLWMALRLSHCGYGSRIPYRDLLYGFGHVPHYHTTIHTYVLLLIIVLFEILCAFTKVRVPTLVTVSWVIAATAIYDTAPQRTGAVEAATPRRAQTRAFFILFVLFVDLVCSTKILARKKSDRDHNVQLNALPSRDILEFVDATANSLDPTQDILPGVRNLLMPQEVVWK